MSALENGLPIREENKAQDGHKIKDRNSSDHVRAGSNAVWGDFNNGYSESCNGVKNTELQSSNQDVEEDCENCPPGVLMSTQKRLPNSDDELQLRDYACSQTGSSTNETTEEPLVKISQPFIRQLSVIQDVSVNCQDSAEREEIGEPYAFSSDIHEAIPELSNVSRPESLSLAQTFWAQDKNEKKPEPNVKASTKCKDSCESDLRIKTFSKPRQPGCQPEPHVQSEMCLSQNLPQGTITRKGDMIQFVADDLMQKIKQSSPMSHPDTASSSSRRSSIRSIASASSSTSFATSSGVSRSPSSGFQQSPDAIPPIDASAVIDLENHARRVADSLDLMMGNIRNNLHKMSAITIGCQDAYKRSVDITCDSVDAGIKSMYALMAKCEELSISMRPVEQLAIQIKEIKRILDLFEAQVIDK